MNNIISLPKFIEMLALASGRDQRFVEKFMTEFTALVYEGLATDGLVKIKGLGQFRVMSDGSKSKVAFVPEPAVSDFINAPFLFFEPTELSDDVNDDMLAGQEVVFEQEEIAYNPTTDQSDNASISPLADLNDVLSEVPGIPQNDTDDILGGLDDTFGDKDPFEDNPFDKHPLSADPFSKDPLLDNPFDDDPLGNEDIKPLADIDLGGLGEDTPSTDPFAGGQAFPFGDLGSDPLDPLASGASDPIGVIDDVLSPVDASSDKHDAVDPSNTPAADFDEIDSVLSGIDTSDTPKVVEPESVTPFKAGGIDDGSASKEYTSRWADIPAKDDDNTAESIEEPVPLPKPTPDKPISNERKKFESNPYDKYDYEEKPFPWFWIALTFVVGLGIGFAIGITCHDIIIPPTYIQPTHEVTTIEDFVDGEEAYPIVAPNPSVPADDNEIGKTDSLGAIQADAADQTALVTKQAENAQMSQPTQPEINSAPEPVGTSPVTSGKVIKNEPLDVNNTPKPTNTPNNNGDSSSGVVYDTVTSDCLLFDLAKKHYGNAAYWVYIYLENSDVISNPNNLRDGQRVRIPPKSKYDVSTNEEENIKSAKNMSREIFAKFN